MAPPCYSGYRFPSDVIHRAIWLDLRFTLSYRDVEDLLAERGLEGIQLSNFVTCPLRSGSVVP
jgi:transposase-like protein